ncbi:MAG: hypothetical protein JXD22_09875 [Sedimentisphaerales bacterium]|nr:hypothetical protein [Sedimentisphaerales bacterium]
MVLRTIVLILTLIGTADLTARAESGAEAINFSGIYPHLASFNKQNECGTGAVVPWAERLWVITYAPHKPYGSDDKLYEIDADLNMTARSESVGGTPANRMIHRESQQLFIGPYVIDKERNVRVIKPEVMPGRLTGNARHLTDPTGKIYFATMEEGFYEVDVRTLAVKNLYIDGNVAVDENVAANKSGNLLPGYHGKGLYSGQGRLIYANNGEHSDLARRKPDVPSGCLAEWDGKDWKVVRRNQFTEVTGPGGIYGNQNPQTDPIWSIGWDHRSLIFMLREEGGWHSFRLPKASHCYDGAHGWYTEWPRIRDIGEEDLLMTMHGMFWRFPKAFSLKNTAGIVPRSSYLMVIGDFCSWQGRVVLGCDVSAKSEFLNKRKAKGDIAGPGQSQSNLRFIQPGQLDDFGAPVGKGGVWMAEPVRGGEYSDPFLFGGFHRRGVHLAHNNKQPVQFTFEVDAKGDGNWTVMRTVTVGAGGYEWVKFSSEERGQWVRIRLDKDCEEATAYFDYSNKDTRPRESNDIFRGLVTPACRKATGGLVRARGAGLKTLHFAAVHSSDGKCEDVGYYEIDADMKLQRVEKPTTLAWLKKHVAVPKNIITVDDASALYIDDEGRRYRLPKGNACFDQTGPLGLERIDREVCTERDLFNCHGTFYELPAENAGGFALVRPIATHNRRISDYCSWRGMLIITGVADDAPGDNEHIIRSEDGKCAVWAGAVDDLWELGKCSGRGGPWYESEVRANDPSDPYLMNGYDEKKMVLTHKADSEVEFTIEVNFDNHGWYKYDSFKVPASETLSYVFPDGFSAHWIRGKVNKDCKATMELIYN